MPHIKVKFFVLCLLLLRPLLSITQVEGWSNKPSFGVYFTPLPMNRYGFSSGIQSDEIYWENTLNLAGTVPLSQKLRVGIQYMRIGTRVQNEAVDHSYLAGMLFQYGFLAQKRTTLYAETGYSFGDFCPCGDAEPFSMEEQSHFWNFGVGANVRLNNWLQAKAGFTNYKPLSKQEDIYNYTQPFIGLNLYFGKRYRAPFKSRFREKKERVARKQDGGFWARDNRQRRWNVGLTSSGAAIRSNVAPPNANPNDPLPKYTEFTLVPRLNYWLNQAMLFGVQGSFYRYNKNYEPDKDVRNGFGLGVQARFYPLNFKNMNTYRAFNIGKSGAFQLAPIFGAELHYTNYSWEAPTEAGTAWDYMDWEPYAGFVLSYKRWFNMVVAMGPTFAFPNHKATAPVFGRQIVGFEYNFSK